MYHPEQHCLWVVRRSWLARSTFGLQNLRRRGRQACVFQGLSWNGCIAFGWVRIRTIDRKVSSNVRQRGRLKIGLPVYSLCKGPWYFGFEIQILLGASMIAWLASQLLILLLRKTWRTRDCDQVELSSFNTRCNCTETDRGSKIYSPRGTSIFQIRSYDGRWMDYRDYEMMNTVDDADSLKVAETLSWWE